MAELARAIAELASPEGRLAVLARHPLDTLSPQVGTRHGPALPRSGVAGGRGRGPAALARFEAHQFEQRTSGGQPFAAWTNRSGDPWQVDLPAGSIDGLVAPTRLLAAFGPTGTLVPGTDPSRTVAIGLLDSWGEVIPATTHVTTAALHFDAPGSRAPQAILIAVPPDLDRPLDAATAMAIVAEARTLAHAGAAIPAQLDEYATALPLTLLPFYPPTGVSLEPA